MNPEEAIDRVINFIRKDPDTNNTLVMEPKEAQALAWMILDIYLENHRRRISHFDFD